MLAVIVTGGKQYKVQKDQVIRIERLKAEEGDKISFDKVVLMQDGDKVILGKDLEKSVVKATIVSHTRAAKISVVKFKRRKRYLRQKGHKQLHTNVRIDSVELKKPAAKKKAAPKKTAKAKSEE